MSQSHIHVKSLVLYANNQLIAFNKPAGLAVQGAKEQGRSLQSLGQGYCKHPLQLIHRIDQPASGVVLMAKNPKAMAHLSDQFQRRLVTKTYWAWVENAPKEPEGALTHYLQREGRLNKSFVVAASTPDALEAQLQYRTLQQSDHYTLLEIELLTGRHHQIRAQLSAIGCPIKGDVKYGARRANADRSIHLHARSLTFTHPVSGQPEQLIAAPPAGDPLWELAQ